MGKEKERPMIGPVSSSDFLSYRDSLANSNTGPDLKAAWTAITEQADAINPRELNELWDFYLERLAECERRGAQ